MAETQNESIGATYAKALLATSEKSGETADVLTDLEALVRDVLASQPRFAEALSSPRISNEEKLAMIDRTLGGRVPPTLLKFLKVVARHGRFNVLPAIAARYRNQVNELAGRAAVTIITAEPMDAGIRSQVEQTVQQRLGKPIDMRAEVDESLIGGIVVRVGDTVFDGSIANRLERLRQTAIRNTAAKLQRT